MKTFKTKAGTELPIRDLRGQDYLDVKYRLVWFREENPLACIRTEFIRLEADYAIAKCAVMTSEGIILATAHKREDSKHFADYTEKAETGAIGRALALIGYGTQFTYELDEGPRIVDAPSDRPSTSTPTIPRVTPKINLKPSDPQNAPEPIRSADEPYLIPVGIHKGKQLQGVFLEDLRADVAWWEDGALKKGRPLMGKHLEYVQTATAYLTSVEKSFDDIPF